MNELKEIARKGDFALHGVDGNHYYLTVTIHTMDHPQHGQTDVAIKIPLRDREPQRTERSTVFMPNGNLTLDDEHTGERISRPFLVDDLVDWYNSLDA